jgi:excisionase family DNA binding protein
MSDWITTEEAAKIAEFHPVYLRELIRKGKIKGKKWARSWLVSRRSVLAYLQATQQLGNRRGAKPKRTS